MVVDASFASFHACVAVKYRLAAALSNQKPIRVTNHHHIIRIIHHNINLIQPDIRAVLIPAAVQMIRFI